MIDIAVGLLWDEPKIEGEMKGSFAIQWRTEPDGWINLRESTGKISAVATPVVPIERWAIRLGEALTEAAAEDIADVVSAASAEYELEILEAGRKWPNGDGEFDNRVWWPVVKLQSLADADEVLHTLRKLTELNPLGCEVVRLDRADAATLYTVTIGEETSQVVDLIARPLNEDSRFELQEVPIGRGFHWERKETLTYRGELRLFQPEGRLLTAVNKLPLEQYLESTVGSEMRSDLPPAFTQAQAIAARSTVLATAGRHHFADGFDLCNDDHCQCYQGTLREAEAVIEPVRKTAGRILTWENRVVDARYAKSCGGASEYYESVWGPQGPDYFDVRPCGEYPLPDLSKEIGAREFLDHDPPAWCNPAEHPYPKPWDEDQLFRWEFEYAPAELGRLIRQKTGVDVGSVRNLRVRRRGKSGRILILSIEGAVQTLKLYGELSIRRALSKSHLPSSFFVVDYMEGKIVLTGGGWGHGVGLCQLGAAAMAKTGFTVEEILEHYYPGAKLQVS